MTITKKIPGLLIGLGLAGGCVWLATRKNLNKAINALKEGNLGEAWNQLAGSSEKAQEPAKQEPAKEQQKQEPPKGQKEEIPTGDRDKDGWYWYYEDRPDIIHKTPFVTPT